MSQAGASLHAAAPSLDEDMRLHELARLAGEAAAPEIAADARALAERIAEGRFYLACVGQFKRGKSTLLNALVGEPVLPVGVIPVTAVVTILRHGAARGACVHRLDGGCQEIALAEVAAYVTEDRNPGNEKGVASVEIFLPAPLLATGMCLVDTPGLGSVFAANTAATRAFVPHTDAALVVLGADPPISGEELALISDVATQIDRLIFVLNKSDRLCASDRAEAAAFAERVLRDWLHRPVGPMLQVSAAERIASGQATRDWEALQRALQALAHQSGSALVHSAAERGFRRLTARLLDEIEERRGALLRPVADSAQRIEALHRCAAQAERSLGDLGYLMNAEQERLAKRIGEQKEKFLQRALPGAAEELAALLRFPEALGRSLAEEQPAAEALYRRAAERFVDLANEFLRTLAESGDPSLAKAARALGAEMGFRVKSRLFYTEKLTLTSRSPVGWITDALRPPGNARRAALRKASEYLEELLTLNASRIERDLDDRVTESRRRLETEIRASLKEVYASAERALAHARESQKRGAEAVQRDLAQLDVWTSRIRELRLEGGE
jgi:hypothetical protein